MSYQAAIKYLESLVNYEKIPVYPYKQSLKLERIKDFLGSIGNPQNSLRCIHVAGTKGKGSTCAFVSYILKEAGFRVGLYTSPHLSDFRERIRILQPRREGAGDFEGMIPKKDLTALVERIKPAVEKFKEASRFGPLSFFEAYTALAFSYFRDKKVDFVVLETGLGGRLDATNVVKKIVCALTPISYEHTQKLGNTLRQIASEKAGIIKNQAAELKGQGLAVISAPQERGARQVIVKCSKENAAKLFEVGKDIVYKKVNNKFCVRSIFHEYTNLGTRLYGEHQLVNASVAIGVIDALRLYGIEVSKAAITRGISNTRWPGRCEVIRRRPLEVLDGAQNIASMRVLKLAIKQCFRYKRLILVLGISKDKDLKGICKEIRPLTDEAVLTRADNPRATAPEKLSGFFPGGNIHITENVIQARAKALALAGRRDLILVTGSLFVVGEYRNA